MAFESLGPAFLALRKRIQRDVFLADDGFFAQDMLYERRGVSRVVRVSVRRRDAIEEGTTDEEIAVMCSKLEDSESEKGYIDKPLVDDRLTPIYGKDRRSYFYTGEIEEEGTIHWVLIFRRHRPVWHGRATA